jgi:hypothetical protein
MEHMRNKIIFILTYWLPVIVVAAIIFKLSSGSVPKASDIFWQDFAAKKLAHVFVYGILAILIFRALVAGGLSKKRAILTAIILSIFYGMTDETHQYFTQGREARIRDVAFDGIGSCLAMIFVTKILTKLPKEAVEIGKRLEII